MSHTTRTSKLRIPCLHETGDEWDAAKTVPDHHPLSDKKIEDLAFLAMDLRDSGECTAAVQVRLNQAISGMTCPRPFCGRVSDRQAEMDEEFCNGLDSHSQDEWIRRLQEIINGGQPDA